MTSDGITLSPLDNARISNTGEMVMKTTWLLAALALTGCSGGGGGGGSDMSTSSLTPTSPAAAAAMTLQGGGTITVNSGNVVTLQSPGAGQRSFAAQDGPAPTDPRSFGGTVLFQQSPGQLPTATIELMSEAAGLSASEFGAWKAYDGAGNLTSENFFAAGQATPATSLPARGSGVSAVYNGSYVANLAHATSLAGTPVAAGPFSGGLTLNANFDTQAVDASFTGLLANIGHPTGGFPASGRMDGSGGYALSGNNFSVPANIRVNMTGQFYGSAAGQAPPETAGLMSGNVGTSPFTGSFGAHR